MTVEKHDKRISSLEGRKERNKTPPDLKKEVQEYADLITKIIAEDKKKASLLIELIKELDSSIAYAKSDPELHSLLPNLETARSTAVALLKGSTHEGDHRGEVTTQ